MTGTSKGFSVKMVKASTPDKKPKGKSVSFNKPKKEGEDESEKSFESVSDDEIESPVKRMVAKQASSNPNLGRGMTLAENDAREF